MAHLCLGFTKAWEEARMTLRLNLPLLAVLVSIYLHNLLFWKTPLIILASSLPLKQSSETSRVAAIVLLHMYDSVHFFRRLGKLTGENKERYATRHGYEIVISSPKRTSGILRSVLCFNASFLRENGTSTKILGPDPSGKCWVEDTSFDIDHSRAPTFGKIKLSIAACIGRPDAWLLWGDADSIIINQSVPLETIIDDAYDLIFSYDWLMLNAGMLLIKCSSWTLSFLQKVYDARKFDMARALDQSAFQEFIDNLSEVDRRAHIKIIPKYAMDVYTEEYRPGDFLMHFAGKLYEATEPGLFAIANQYDILSTVDDFEDIEAFFRGRHLLNYYSGTCKVSPHEQQRDCLPNDPRRITLNESLGTMAFPNRYRHVGLRYYWLGSWKDKYDISEWNQFKKPLAIVSRVERELHFQRERPMLPPTEFHYNRDNQQHPPDGKNGHVVKPALKRDNGAGNDDGNNENGVEDSVGKNRRHINQRNNDGRENNYRDSLGGHHDFDLRDREGAHHQQQVHVDSLGNKDDDQLLQHNDEADEDNESRSSFIWISLTTIVVGGACLFLTLTKRRKMSSKTQ